jgi:hypothetical protein
MKQLKYEAFRACNPLVTDKFSGRQATQGLQWGLTNTSMSMHFFFALPAFRQQMND